MNETLRETLSAALSDKINKWSQRSAAGNKKEISEFYNLLAYETCSERFEKAIKCIEAFFWRHPLQRGLLIHLYVDSITELGNAELSLEIARIYTEVTQSVLDVGQNNLGLPPIVESNWFFERIGELADTGAYIKLMLELNLIGQKPVICIGEEFKITNKAFLPYLSDCFEVISNEADSKYLSMHAHLSPMNTQFFKYSSEDYGYNNNFFHVSYKDFMSTQSSPYAFVLKDQTITIAQSFLKIYGLRPNDDFIVLHLREVGNFSADGANNYFRNSNPYNFSDAINWFLKLGIKVVRIGHKKMMPLPPCPGLIDLTHQDRPGEVDIYLCGAAKFYFGSGSGPFSLAYNFGVPIAYVDAFPYGVNRPNTFQQFKPLKCTKTKKILTFSDVTQRGLKLVTAKAVMDKRGVIPECSTNEENLVFAKEMIEFIEKGTIFNDNRKLLDKKLEHGVNYDLCSQSLQLLN